MGKLGRNRFCLSVHCGINAPTFRGRMAMGLFRWLRRNERPKDADESAEASELTILFHHHVDGVRNQMPDNEKMGRLFDALQRAWNAKYSLIEERVYDTISDSARHSVGVQECVQEGGDGLYWLVDAIPVALRDARDYFARGTPHDLY